MSQWKLQLMSTGSQRGWSHQLKIKDNVVLVGLSLLLPVFSHISELKELMLVYLSNSSLIVLDHMEIMDAMVVPMWKV